MPKIIFINQTFYPDLVATAQQLTDAAVELAGKGHAVTVLTSRRGYSPPHSLYARKELYRGVEILRVWPFAWRRENRFARKIDTFLHLTAYAFRILFLPRYDIVVTLTSPPMIPLIAAFFARLRKSRLVYWSMDLNPDEAIAAGWIKAGSWSANLLRRMSSYVLKQSGFVVALDDYMKGRLLDYGIASDKVYVVPPWIHDEIKAVEHSKNPFRKRIGLDGKFVVMYSGNHSVCHPLDTLLESALKLRNDASVVFVFIGSGARVSDVLDFKCEHFLQNIIHLPYQRREELGLSLSAADLHTVVMGEKFSGIVHPSKIYGILQTGRPFIYIGPRKSPIGDLIARCRHGFQVDHGDSSQLIEVINQVKDYDPHLLSQIGKDEQAFAERYHQKVVCPRMAQIILDGFNDRGGIG